jgi:hypothetical protein
MDIAKAQRASELAAYIKPRLEKISQIDQLIADGWLVSGIQVEAGDGSQGPMSLILDRLDAGTSAKALGFAKQIYQAQLAPAQAELDAL